MEPLLQFFKYDHLPPHLQAVSRDFALLAVKLVREQPRNPERTVALRKLLEAKDCAVRSVLYRDFVTVTELGTYFERCSDAETIPVPTDVKIEVGARFLVAATGGVLDRDPR